MDFLSKIRGWLNDRGLDALREQVVKLNVAKDHQPLIVVFADWGYLDVLLNWMEAIRRLDIEHYVVVALDKKIHQRLRSGGTRTILAEGGKRLRDVWILRIDVFRCLISCGIDFVHSDADAIWLRNPIAEYFEAEKQLDLIASQGTRWPPDVFRQWGFVLCCGLFYMRSTTASLELLETLRRHVDTTGDDHQSLNQVLMDMKIDWDFEPEYQVPFKDCLLRCSNSMIRSRGAGLRVGVLPFKRFPRLADQQDHPYVVHPITRKNCSDKIQGLSQWNLWFLEQHLKG